MDMWRYASDLSVDNIFARCMNNFEDNQDIELTPEQKKILFDLIVSSSDMPPDYRHPFAQNLLYPILFTGNLPSRCWSVLLGHNLGIKQDGECDPNKCRHFRLNLVLEGSLKGQYKCPDQSKFMEMHAAFL